LELKVQQETAEASSPTTQYVKQTAPAVSRAVVQLCHHTVKKFLAGPTADPYVIDEVNGNREIVHGCVRYLEVMLAPKRLFAGFPDSNERGHLQSASGFEAFSEYLNQHPLFYYIFCFFHQHLQALAGD
jgi:hypothetical protein